MKTWTIPTLLLLTTLLPLVHGATVTVTPSVLIRTQYGQLTTSTNSQSYLNFTVYANATVAFFVTPSPIYTFIAKAFGNGTMLVKFFGPPPVQVNSNLPATYTNGRLLLSYSTSLTETLVVIYSQAVIISNSYSNGSLLWLSLFGLIVITAFLFPHLNLLSGTRTGRINSKGQEQKRIYTAEEYEKEVKQRTKIVIIFLVVGAIASAFAAYFLTRG